MYQTRRARKRRPFLNLILLGVLAGVGYLIYDQASHPAPTENTAVVELPTLTPTIPITPTAILESLIGGFQPTPTATSAITQVDLTIPNAGVAARVIQVYLNNEGTWDVSSLGMNAGHLQGTNWITTPGNIVLAGHVEMSNGGPGIFARIHNLSLGDRMFLEVMGEDNRTYAVTNVQRVDPSDLSVLYPSEFDILTLITCSDYDFISDVYQERIVVTARRVT